MFAWRYCSHATVLNICFLEGLDHGAAEALRRPLEIIPANSPQWDRADSRHQDKYPLPQGSIQGKPLSGEDRLLSRIVSCII